VLPTDANVIENRGGAESTGLEFELGWAFTERFSATLAAAWNDPTYRDATFIASVACDGVRCTPGSIVGGVGNANIDGNTLERQSRLSGSLLLDYRRELADGLDLWSTLDFNYQGSQYVDAFNLAETGARTLVNARVGLARGRWEASVWSRNLLDERYVANSFVVFFANSYVVGLGDERSWGVTLRYRL
jgi:iron complex outermembrane receptor protein